MRSGEHSTGYLLCICDSLALMAHIFHLELVHCSDIVVE